MNEELRAVAPIASDGRAPGPNTGTALQTGVGDVRGFFVAAGRPLLRAPGTIESRALIHGDRPSRARLMLDFAACLAITLLAGVGTVFA